MAKYSIQDTTLTALGDAIRSKTTDTAVKVYTTDTYTQTFQSGNTPMYKYIPRDYYTNVAMPYHHVKVKITYECDTELDYSVLTYQSRDGYSYFDFTLDENNEAILYTDSREGWVSIYIDSSALPTGYSIKINYELTPYLEDGSYIGLQKEAPNTMTPLEMVDAINTIAPPFSAEDLTFTGNCMYSFCGNGWVNFINKYADSIVTKDIDSAQNMFYMYGGDTIPFEINFNGGYWSGTTLTSGNNLSNMFYSCNMKEMPKINYCVPTSMDNMFNTCAYLRYIPEDINSWFNWQYLDNPNMTQGSASRYSGSTSNLFNGCYSLRSPIPMDFINHGNVQATEYYCTYESLFKDCFSLDEAVGIPFPHQHKDCYFASNVFTYTFYSCNRLKNLTFALQEDGSPYVCKWKNQTLNLADQVGYTNYKFRMTSYNSGITTDTQITDDETYAALKDNPDNWTADINYSRYNHDSAVATINSLPDTSAFLTEYGGTNTIKFEGAAGALTDGGAINTLTEEEIAVATAKGWTVTLV